MFARRRRSGGGAPRAGDFIKQCWRCAAAGNRVYRIGRDMTLFNGVRVPSVALARFAEYEQCRR